MRAAAHRQAVSQIAVGQRSFDVKPVFLAILASIFGPISTSS